MRDVPLCRWHLITKNVGANRKVHTRQTFITTDTAATQAPPPNTVEGKEFPPPPPCDKNVLTIVAHFFWPERFDHESVFGQDPLDGLAARRAHRPPPRRLFRYRGYSKLRAHTAIGPYGMSIPRSIGHSQGWCVSLNSSNPSMGCGV